MGPTMPVAMPRPMDQAAEKSCAQKQRRMCAASDVASASAGGSGTRQQPAGMPNPRIAYQGGDPAARCRRGATQGKTR